MEARALFDDRLRQWGSESQELRARTQATPRII
jgi:hypothetical protein